MIPLIQLPGANPVALFDSALNAAHARAAAGSQHDEPYIVRELITDTTIRALNTAAANSYDENLNIVRFRGGFLHARPWAVFDAYDSLGNKAGCRRELADAMLIFHLTEQDGTGAHKIVRRAACLLMFKKSDVAAPTTPIYIPRGSKLPSGTDQEQFYLFNQWPTFDLTTSAGTKMKGKGNYALSNNAYFNIGKYALLWDATVMPSLWLGRWRYADPVQSMPVNDTLGSLISKLVDSHQSAGKSFDPAGTSDWDILLGDLLHYSEVRVWKGSRNANPAGLSLLSNFEALVENLGTCMQHARLGSALFYDWYPPNHFNHLFGYQGMYDEKSNAANEHDLDRMPIIFATASSFKSPERGERPPLGARKEALRNALRSFR